MDTGVLAPRHTCCYHLKPSPLWSTSALWVQTGPLGHVLPPPPPPFHHRHQPPRLGRHNGECFGRKPRPICASPLFSLTGQHQSAPRGSWLLGMPQDASIWTRICVGVLPLTRTPALSGATVWVRWGLGQVLLQQASSCFADLGVPCAQVSRKCCGLYPPTVHFADSAGLQVPLQGVINFFSKIYSGSAVN